METTMRIVRKGCAAIGLASLVAAGLSGCKGNSGQDHGTIVGTVTLQGTTTPAVGVKVATDIGGFATATDGDGKYALDVPIGVYAVSFGAGMNNDGFEPITIQNVSVMAGGSRTLNASVVQSNPLALTLIQRRQTGFAQTVTLGVSVAGAPSGVTPTYAWTQTAGSPVTLSGANTAAPTFVTRKLGDVIAENQLNRASALPALVPVRRGAVPISTQQETELSYTFKVTVTAGRFVKTGTTTITSAAVTAAGKAVPVGINIILGATPISRDQGRYAWAIAAAPAGSTATLEFGTEQFATFVPDKEGQYTVTESGGRTPWSQTFVAAAYTGPGTYVSPPVAVGCVFCHNNLPPPTPGPEQVRNWLTSGHKQLFQKGISGLASDHYSAACTSCHTTGNFNGGTIKGSFGDKATQLGWRFPTTLSPAAWDGMTPDLKDLGSISCESCHGPGNQHFGDRTKIAKNMSNNTCNQCHEAVGHHDRGFLASKGAHHNLSLTLDQATVEGRGTTAAHCGRCHSAQGFKVYVKQLSRADLTPAQRIGPLLKPNGTAADVPWLTSLGMTKADIDNPGCATCHEPHAAKLRIEGSTPTLPAGFAVAEVGKGAICMTCHNTRNGLHDDRNPPPSNTAPHTPSQADILMGKNAYFVNTDLSISRHAAAEDTCATCHVAIAPKNLPFLPAGYQMPGTNHTFTVNSSICASCHSSSVTGESLQAQVQEGLNAINTAAGRVLWNTLNSYVIDPGNPGFKVIAFDQGTDCSTRQLTITALPADSRSFSFALEIHGQESACLRLPAPIPVTWDGASCASAPATITDLCFQMGNLKQMDGTTPIVPGNSLMTKALWNYYLVKGDGSRGIHNPTFVFEILRKTVEELNRG